MGVFARNQWQEVPSEMESQRRSCEAGSSHASARSGLLSINPSIIALKFRISTQREQEIDWGIPNQGVGYIDFAGLVWP
jgi:hypothetical protein